MGMNLTDIHDALEKRRTMGYLDDFQWYISPHLWTSLLAGSATATVGNTQGGILTLATIDSTLNRELYVYLTNSNFLFAANNPIYVESLLQFTEANTNKANMAFGLMNSIGAASIADTTGEPKSSYSGAVIYKVPGGTMWKTQSSLGTTQTTTQSSTTAGGSTYQRLGIEVKPISSTVLEVSYYVNGVQLRDNTYNRPIKDQLTFTGALAMTLFHCCKNGSTTAESLLVDYTAWEHMTRQLLT